MEDFNPQEEYLKALKRGRKDSARAAAEGRPDHVLVLDDIFPDAASAQAVDLGILDIPMDRIVGTKTAGRQFAFSPNFLPLMDTDTEFAYKWANLCQASMTYNGISDPISCFEYYGDFYVQEGNKRVSLLRYYGSPIIPGQVTRLMPTDTDSPRYALYQEFLEFYQIAGLYSVQFSLPGSYRKLLVRLEAEEPWSEDFRHRFVSRYSRFTTAMEGRIALYDLTPADVFLLFLRYHDLQTLHEMPLQQLKDTISALQNDVIALSQDKPVSVHTAPADSQKETILDKLIFRRPKTLHIAFVHERTVETSAWTAGHELGRTYLEQVLSDHITTASYFDAQPGKDSEEVLERAIAAGANVVFTTTAQLANAALRVAIRHPDVHLLNCSVNMPYPDIRTYYARVYEGKFITGAIAGAMCRDGQIGYVGSYPIFGVPASINAFALGARMVNPDVRIHLQWSCTRPDYFEQFRKQGIRVVSGRDTPITSHEGADHGTCLIEDDGTVTPLASPIWNWGVIYERIVRSILDGSWAQEQQQAGARAVNYWWGMSSGAADVQLSDALPQSVCTLAEILANSLQSGNFSPFDKPFRTQDGRIMSGLSVDEILQMDYLCDCVDGTIPTYGELLPMAQKTVRLLGIYRDQIPPEKEDNAL